MPSRCSSHPYRNRLLALLLAGAWACGSPPDEPAPRVDVDPGLKSRVSVSGVSAGGYLAHQLHIAYADKVGSAAVVAAGPWHCAEGSVQTALSRCMTGEGLDIAPLAAALRDAAATGTVAPLEALAVSRVWIFHSPADGVVSPTVGEALRKFYSLFVSESDIAYVDSVAAAHGWVTEDTGAPCDEAGGDYINACGYDAAGELLAHSYGALQARGAAAAGSLVSLDVSPYFDGDADVAESAYTFIPETCATDTVDCRLHISLHGCTQGAEFVDDRLVTQVGLNEWAATNSIVVVYPQLEKSMFNPNGCWDWWGYTGDDYDRRSAPQLAGLSAIIDAFAAGKLLTSQPET